MNGDGSLSPAEKETEGSVCPIRALDHYLTVSGSTEGPLFTFGDGCPLSRQQLSFTALSILSAAGYLGVYSGHSFRIGAATTTAAQGVPERLIKTLGQWSSDAYQIYTRTPVHSIVTSLSSDGFLAGI